MWKIFDVLYRNAQFDKTYNPCYNNFVGRKIMLKFIVSKDFLTKMSKAVENDAIQTNRPLTNLLLLIEMQEAELYITPESEFEIQQCDALTSSFMSKYCKRGFFDYDDDELATNLAYNYGNTKVDNSHPIVDAKDEKSKNYKDALFLAQASVLQAVLEQKAPVLTDKTFNINAVNVINQNFGLSPIEVYDFNDLNKAIENGDLEL